MRAELVELGWASQTAVGTPAANPAYVIQGLLSPGLPEPQQHTYPVLPATAQKGAQGLRKGAEWWAADVSPPAFPRSAGLPLLALMGEEAVTGGGPYVHTFTAQGGTTAPEALTLFSYRAGLYERWDDGIVESVELAWDQAASPVALRTVVQGRAPNVLGSAYTPGATDRMDHAGDWLTAAGATMKLDLASSPAATDVAANVEQGSIMVRRALEMQPRATSRQPLGFDRGPWEVLCSLTYTWTDDDLYRATFYGSGAGSSASATIVEGSLDFAFKPRPGIATGHQLRVKVDRMVLHVGPPQAGHGLSTLQIEGTGLAGTGAELASFALTNGLSGAY